MTSWLGFDSTSPELIPTGAFAFLYYNGDYATSPQITARHPRRAMIDVLGDAWSACSVLQIDGTQAEIARLIALAPDWVHNRNTYRAGTATLYTDEANLPAIQRAFEQAGQSLDFWVWLATLNGTVCLSEVPGGVGRLAAVQGWSETLLGWHADATCILSGEWYAAHGG